MAIKEAKKTAPAKPAAAKAASKAVATRQEAGMPANLDLDSHAGKGVSTSSQDVGIPFLGILEALSPQLKARHEKYIEDAELGMIINTQTKELWAADDGVLFIPCYFKSALVEWVPRDSGGGWVAEHPMGTSFPGMTRPDPKKPPVLPNGNQIVETKYYFGLIVGDEGYEPAVIGMSSSRIKSSREWQGMFKRVKTASGAVAPSFAKVYRLKSLAVNKGDNDWHIWEISEERWVSSDELKLASQLEAECAMGNVKAERPSDDSMTGGTSPASEEVL